MEINKLNDLYFNKIMKHIKNVTNEIKLYNQLNTKVINHQQGGMNLGNGNDNRITGYNTYDMLSSANNSPRSSSSSSSSNQYINMIMPTIDIDARHINKTIELIRALHFTETEINKVQQTIRKVTAEKKIETRMKEEAIREQQIANQSQLKAIEEKNNAIIEKDDAIRVKTDALRERQIALEHKESAELIRDTALELNNRLSSERDANLNEISSLKATIDNSIMPQISIDDCAHFEVVREQYYLYFMRLSDMITTGIDSNKSKIYIYINSMISILESSDRHFYPMLRSIQNKTRLREKIITLIKLNVNRPPLIHSLNYKTIENFYDNIMNNTFSIDSAITSSLNIENYTSIYSYIKGTNECNEVLDLFNRNINAHIDKLITINNYMLYLYESIYNIYNDMTNDAHPSASSGASSGSSSGASSGSSSGSSSGAISGSSSKLNTAANSVQRMQSVVNRFSPSTNNIKSSTEIDLEEPWEEVGKTTKTGSRPPARTVQRPLNNSFENRNRTYSTNTTGNYKSSPP